MAKSKNRYTVQKRKGAWYVIAPSGLAVVVPHETRREAFFVAAVFNRTGRAEHTVKTEKPGPIFVEISGGVANVFEDSVPRGYAVELIDWDNLRADPENEFERLSGPAQAFVLAEDPEFENRFKEEVARG
jgi:hypothetical protein